MTKYFYCETHKKDEPMSIYGGEVGKRKYCLKTIAAARRCKAIADKEKLQAIPEKDLPVRTARATSEQQKQAADRKARLDEYIAAREDRLIDEMAFAI